ncbi:acetyl-CoA carboxylase biotin carboxyl carrier protein subunit [Formosa maritima]|uniref:Biotin/lipoyl-binding protein n=1 Tax=Formosa maritima TaxID=2592046 RepID=A0A5D0GER2_9FLAO|nr:acetyl-CoA carboxylase biotin carboxyl carrier protein subunit [Formosa maritima]TYA56317.1 biotin/lipoyl-binding protein [Formosa maritima]
MPKTFKIHVNNSFEFDIEPEKITEFDAISLASNQYHILENNKSYKAKITNQDFINKTYTILINNNSYTVEINNALDELIKKMGFEVGTTKKINDIKAPMPGLILDINVKVGQEVKEDDPLLILEAMKMENMLTSPRDGVIKSIAVSKSETVDKNQLLIEFE